MSQDSRLETHQHIAEVRGLLLGSAMELMGRGHIHDQSKLESPEVEIFNEFGPRLKDLIFGSDEYEECRREMGKALEHHYANNSHHPEHFDSGIEGMSLFDLIEMICDWMASVRRHADGDIMKSIEKNQARFGYSDEMKQILTNTVVAVLGLPES